TANGNAISVDPTEFQWFVTATHSVSGQKLRLPLYYRAVTPTIQNIASPALAAVLADQPAQAPSTCVRDTNSSYTLQWAYTVPTGGPNPVGFRLQEATRSADVFFDPATEVLVAGANSTWAAGNDWSSQVDP